MTITSIPPEMPYGINVVEKRPTMTLTDSRIGSGGCSVVNWGFSNVGSPLAVKKLKDRVTAENETKALKLGIPHTPRFRDMFEKTVLEKTEYNIVMDQVNEKTIERVYLSDKSKRMLNFAEIRSILHQTLEALVYCEDKKIILFDLKTNNMIWQAASWTLTLIDLGSVNEARNEYEVDPLQTPEYLAPEWMLKGNITPSYDIWSLGCVLYQMIVGKNLFSRWVGSGLSEFTLYDDILWQIVSEMGRPREAYLAGCKRAEWFTQVFPIDEFPEVPTKSNWESNVKKALSDGGMEEKEIEEWMQLLRSMLCYENRASAKTLLNHPIFKGEIHFNLKSDPTIKCTMHLCRQSKAGQSSGSEDLTMDINADKNRCLHIPRDPKGEYLLTLQTDELELMNSISLKNNGTLDITSYQAQLRDFNPSPLESSNKKSKIDDWSE